MVYPNQNFNPVGIITRNYLLAQFQNVYTPYYNSIINIYEQNNLGLFVRKGPNKVKPRYPMISIEAATLKQEWVAINYFKEYTVELSIDVFVKALGANVGDTEQGGNQDDAVAVMETYLLHLTEFTQHILNAPENVRFELNLDMNGNPNPNPFYCNNSFASDANMTWLYEGAIRAARLSWTGTIQAVGKTNHWLDLETQ